MGKTIEMTPNGNGQDMTMEQAQAEIKKLQDEGKINKPTQEETEAKAKEFEEAKVNFENKAFEIGTAEVADEIYDFMINFIENHVFWTENGWMGVVRMHKELNEKKKERKENEPFQVGYQALEFMLFALTKPGGFGLKSAQNVEKVADFYINLIEMTGKVVEAARKELKDIQFIGDQAVAMQQGFFLEEEPKEGEETKDSPFSAPSVDELLNKK